MSDQVTSTPTVAIPVGTPTEQTSQSASTPGTPSAPEVSQVASLEAKQANGEKLTKAEEKRIEKFKLKVYGKDIEESIDLNDKAALTKRFQKAHAADKSMAEAADVRKAAMQFLDELKKNPKKVLSDPNIAIDLKKFAQDILNEEIQEMEKSPEQKEREKLQKELEGIKKQRDQEKKDWEAKEFTRIQEQHTKQLETDIATALDVGGLPKTALTVSKMANYMIIAMENGIELSPQEIAPIVKNTTLSEFKELVNSLSDDQLEDFMGKEILGRLRKKQVAKAKAPIQTANDVKATGTESSKKKDEKPGKPLNYRDFFGF